MFVRTNIFCGNVSVVSQSVDCRLEWPSSNSRFIHFEYSAGVPSLCFRRSFLPLTFPPDLIYELDFCIDLPMFLLNFDLNLGRINELLSLEGKSFDKTSVYLCEAAIKINHQSNKQITGVKIFHYCILLSATAHFPYFYTYTPTGIGHYFISMENKKIFANTLIKETPE